MLTRYTQKEHQAQTLYSANDYIQHTEHAETYVCADPGVLEAFPELDGKPVYGEHLMFRSLIDKSSLSRYKHYNSQKFDLQG